MKFSQSSFVYFNYPLQEAIRRLHNFGYQSIEIWGGRPHTYKRDLDDQLKEISSLLSELDMTVPNYIPAQFRYPSVLCSSNEKIRMSSVEYIKTAIDTAIRLEIPRLSLCPGMVVFGEDVKKGWNQLCRSITELLDYSAGFNLILLIELAHSAESNLIRTVEDGLRMIKDVNSDKVGILLDTGHVFLNGENLADALMNLRDVPLHIHIDDNNGDNDAHMIPGDGSIDFKPFAEKLKEINYQGFITGELGFQYTLDPDPAVKKTLSFLTSLFKS